MDHEGRRGGARAFGRRPTTRAAAWRCLARHALKRTTAVLQPCTQYGEATGTRSRTTRAPRCRGTAHRGPALTSGVRLSPAWTRGPLDCRVTVTSIISQAPTALPLAGEHMSDNPPSVTSRIMPAARPSGAGLQENILMRTAHDTHETTVQRRGGEVPTNSQASRQPPRASVGAVATRGSALAHVGRRHSTLRCPGRFASDRAPRASRARSTSPNVSGYDRSRCHHPHRHGARAERPCDSLLSLYWKGPRLSGFTRAAAHMRP